MDLDKKEYIFIVGAAKCGTTALADMLDQHQNICLSYPKEPDFFTDRLFPKGFDWYEDCFKDKSCRYRLDSSVSYTAGWKGTSSNVAKRIHEFCPTAKIIYLMRDPLERTWSSYWHAKRNGRDEPSFEETVLNPSSDHITASMYKERVEDYLLFFPLEQVLLLRQVDLQKEPSEVLKIVEDFIGVEGVVSSVENESRRVNSSYQFNWFGNLIVKIIPLSFIKRVAHFANRNFPRVTGVAKSLMASPVPSLDKKSAEAVIPYYDEGLVDLEEKYGISLKTSRWW